MMAELWNERGSERTGQLDAEPVCGEDFCDSCGDCLYCYGGEYCPDGSHRWIVYADNLDDFMAKHPGAATVNAIPAPAGRDAS